MQTAKTICAICFIVWMILTMAAGLACSYAFTHGHPRQWDALAAEAICLTGAVVSYAVLCIISRTPAQSD